MNAAPVVPVYSFSVWILAGFDPLLILIAVFLGWKADQFGKVFIAAIAALGVSVLFAWLVTRIGLPWPAPCRRRPADVLSGANGLGVSLGRRRIWRAAGVQPASLIAAPVLYGCID
ncbi:hypothetical protein M2437_003409 [Methylorubrum pseudosasae]|nr:hypothetical protein [Methylorubrum pseudosasae]